jgi:16S rRNA U1498 N3-methylase RsmE
MKYTLDSGKVINIPDTEIKHHMDTLGISQDDAINLYLEDEGYLDNDELDELDEKAKKVKIQHQATTTEKSQTKAKKPRTVKISNEKQALFDDIYNFLLENYGQSVEVAKENKLLTLKVGEKSFKVDLIEQRPPKA